MRRLVALVTIFVLAAIAFLAVHETQGEVQAQAISQRYVVFESFMRAECGNCGQAGPVVDQLDTQYAREGKKVLFIEHNNDDCATNPASGQKQPCVGSNLRKQIYAVARPDARVLPLMMADSGAKTHWGASQDWLRQIKSMVDPELRRLEQADISAYFTRTGNTARVVAFVTNKSGRTLTAADRAQVWVVLIEDAHVVHTNHYVRGVKPILITEDLPNGATGRYETEISGTAGLDWRRVRIAVFVDVRSVEGTFEMLQATIATQGEPTPTPTEEPTAEPTEEPTEEPTAEPTQEPTVEPTEAPTEAPTPEPTQREGFWLYLPVGYVNWSLGQ